MTRSVTKSGAGNVGPDLLSEEFRGHAGHEPGIRLYVPAHQPSRLLRQAEKPLQSVVSHPRRRHASQPGVKIECRADADLHGPNRLAMLVGEVVLFGTSQAEEDDRRAT